MHRPRDIANVDEQAESKTGAAIARLSLSMLALVSTPELPALHNLERVYWRQRVGAGFAAVPTTLKRDPQLAVRMAAQYPYQGAWPCLWGEEIAGPMSQAARLNEVPCE